MRVSRTSLYYYSARRVKRDAFWAALLATAAFFTVAFGGTFEMNFGRTLDTTLPQTSDLEIYPLTVKIEATSLCWIRVITDGFHRYDKFLKEGEVETIGALKTIKLRLGNAGGVVIEANGEKFVPGKPGEPKTVMVTLKGVETY